MQQCSQGGAAVNSTSPKGGPLLQPLAAAAAASGRGARWRPDPLVPPPWRQSNAARAARAPGQGGKNVLPLPAWARRPWDLVSPPSRVAPRGACARRQPVWTRPGTGHYCTGHSVPAGGGVSILAAQRSSRATTPVPPASPPPSPPPLPALRAPAGRRRPASLLWSGAEPPPAHRIGRGGGIPDISTDTGTVSQSWYVECGGGRRAEARFFLFFYRALEGALPPPSSRPPSLADPTRGSP